MTETHAGAVLLSADAAAQIRAAMAETLEEDFAALVEPEEDDHLYGESSGPRSIGCAPPSSCSTRPWRARNDDS